MDIQNDLDRRAYFQILHAMFLDDASDAEIERANKVMEWVNDHRLTIERVTSNEERLMIGIVWEYWTDKKMPATRNSLDTVIRNRSKPKVYLDLLEEYDTHSMDLRLLTHAEMDLPLQLRTEDFERERMLRVAEVFKQITLGSIPNPKDTSFKKLPPLSGPRDAMNYVMEKFQGGMFVKGSFARGGLLAEHGNRVLDLISEAEQNRVNSHLTIPTGIPLIDRTMGGLRRKEMTGILGYKGQRKTAVVRTMAYNAAAGGFNVLHVPIETDFDEEVMVYSIIHAHTLATRKNRKSSLTKRKVDDGVLTNAERSELIEATKDFVATVGKNLTVRKPGKASWGTVKAMIEIEALRRPLDLVIVDYFTLLTHGLSHFEKDGAMIAAIQDAKQLTFDLNDGKGVAFVTPVQGNRKGYEEAASSDGAWDTTGIYQYSELDKSLDNCLYVYSTPEIAANGQIKMGSCKYRRGADIPSTFVPLNVGAGILIDDEPRDEVVQVGLPPLGKDGKIFSFLHPK